MQESTNPNPLLPALRDALSAKRAKRTGFVPRSWLLVLLRVLDQVRDSEEKLSEDDLYTYDFTLKGSRAAAIPKLLNKYAFPTETGLGNEGITTRGAPGLRFFRAIDGGAVLGAVPTPERAVMLDQAVEMIRAELMQVLGQQPVKLAEHVFAQTGTFVPALLKAVANRSNGRVEQALVGAKLHLRYSPAGHEVECNPGFAADRQTGREADFTIENLRVIVSVSPKSGHFEDAKRLADLGRQVALVVSEEAAVSAKKRIRESGYGGKVVVQTVDDYVTNNMQEIATAERLSASEVCIKLVSEYNRRIVLDNDHSLQVVPPARGES